MKKTILIILSLLVLTGCGSSGNGETSTDETDVSSFTGTYYRMINKGRGTNSESFYLEFSNTKDFVNIGSGLQILSQDYYDVDDYYLAEGQQLSNDDYTQLLRRDSKDSKTKSYPNTLQVKWGEKLEGIEAPIMISQIAEQDYYEKSGSGYKLAGLSFAIILDPETADREELDVDLSKSTIKSYSETTVKKLYNYLRKKDELKDLPMLITVYQANDDELSRINGTFLYSSYCDRGDIGSLKTVNQKTVIFTSSEAKNIDPTTYADFTTFKGQVKKAATEAAGVVGTANYIKDSIQYMKIEARLNIKTYTELLYVTSIIAENMDSRFTIDFNMSCLVYSQDELVAVIIKNKGQDATTNVISQ